MVCYVFVQKQVRKIIYVYFYMHKETVEGREELNEMEQLGKIFTVFSYIIFEHRCLFSKNV